MRRFFKRFTLLAALALLPLISSARLAALERIVSLKPNITELLFAMGAGGEVVGVTSWCDFPKEARTLPKVGDYMDIDVEKVLSLRPTLVVGSKEGSRRAPILALEDAGVPVLLLPFGNLEELFSSTLALGERLRRKEEAARLVERWKDGLALMREEPKRRVLAVVGKRPLVAAGSRSYIGELISIAGGRNVLDTDLPYVRISREHISAMDPEIIIDMTMGGEGSDMGYLDGLEVGAVKEGRVYREDMSEFRLGPRILDQVRRLREIIGGGR